MSIHIGYDELLKNLDSENPSVILKDSLQNLDVQLIIIGNNSDWINSKYVKDFLSELPTESTVIDFFDVLPNKEFSKGNILKFGTGMNF